MTTFLIGYYGFLNAGDDYLFKKAIQLLKASDPDTHISVLTQSPLEFSDSHIFCVFRSQWLTILKTLYSCKKVVLGGGSLLQNKSSKASLFYYLFLLGLAQFFNKPCLGLGLGVGPIQGWFSKWMTRRVLKKFDSISFRDEDSYSTFSMGCSKRFLSSDLLFYDTCQGSSRFSLEASVGLSLNAAYDTKGIHFLKKSSINFSVIAAQKECDDQLFSVFSEGYYLHDLLEGKYADSLFFSCVVSSRYHTCLWAALLGIPFISVGTDPKCVSLSTIFGQEHHVEISSDLVQTIDHVIHHSDHYISLLNVGVKASLLNSKKHNHVLDDGVSLFGFDLCTMSMPEMIDSLNHMSKHDQLIRIVTLNPQMVIESDRNPDLKHWLQSADLIVPDGQGIVLASKIICKKTIQPIPGIDLMEHICSLPVKVYLVGGHEQRLLKAIKVLQSRFLSLCICGSSHGYISSEAYGELIEDIKISQPDYIFVGMGFPKQETFIRCLLESGVTGIVVGVGGAFDVFSGALSRAPEWVRTLRCEWVYRGMIEPKRVLKWGFLPQYFLKLSTFLLFK